MRKSAVPVTHREALQCFLGQPVADMDEKKSVCWASAASFERRCAAIGSLDNASAQPQNMRWGWKKKTTNNLLLVIRPDCLCLATFLPHAQLSLPLSESSIIAKWLASVNIFHVGWWYSCSSFEWQEVMYEVIGHFITWFIAALEGIFGSCTSCDRMLVLWLRDNLLPNVLC